MKIIENILAQLTDTDTLLESVYQAIAEVDPNYAEEMAIYEQSVQTLPRYRRRGKAADNRTLGLKSSIFYFCNNYLVVAHQSA